MFTRRQSAAASHRSSRRPATLERLEDRQLFSAAPTLWADDNQGRLFTVNVATGNVHVIGQMPAVMFDIAFDAKGNLYGVDSGNGSNSALWKINPTNASATRIGNVGAFVNALVFSRTGTLYAAGSSLYAVNTATGHGAAVGTGHLSGYASAGDLAFDAAGNLYLSTSSNQLVRVSTSTGAATLVGSMGFQQVFGMAYGPDHVLYGLSNATDQIFTINPANGHGTLESSFANKGVAGVNGSTFITEADPIAQSIEVDGNGTKIADGEAAPSAANGTDFGSVSLGAKALRTFVIRNNTAATLTLTGNPRVLVNGLNASDFTVVSNPASSVAPGQTTSFTVAFSPRAAGTRIAEVTIANSNAADGKYHFEIRGSGVAKPAGTTIYACDANGALFTVSSATGATHIIGRMSSVMYDIGFSPSGALYGIDSHDDIYTINPSTAAITFVGSIGVSDNINSLTFDSKGILYCAGQHLYAVNLATRTFYDRGSLGGYASAGDLAFDARGQLVMSTTSNDLIAVNPTTAAVSRIGSIGFSDVLGLAEGTDGVLYGMSNATDQIFSINPITGKGASPVHFSGVNGVFGAAVKPA